MRSKRRKGNNNERLCLGCLRLRDKWTLMRIAVFRDGNVIIDKAQKSGGRGAYICPIADCLIAATKKGTWSRGFKRPVSVQKLNELLSLLKRHIFWMSGDLPRLW
ncbi:MAG: YlxR family protein [Candidatus Fervidibacter sp.]|uniref:YlxR family protein n=1 Tax=Candidatus Fervidibacter sp. TaxID=3100871 RepID=UPI00404A5137